MSVYQVTGKLAYRGHPPGARFEATLDRYAESRAVRRGAIKIIHRSVPRLVEGSYRLPKQHQEEVGSDAREANPA